jgi:threonine dehydrogenase-like Zn-dependent dehydrogenase
MQALVYKAPRQVVWESWPRPRPVAGEAEIAVSAAGICGSDVAAFLGLSHRRTPPMILGHEVVGHTSDGRRVVADPILPCGHCPQCLAGAPNLCPRLGLLGMDSVPGCFAEYVSLPASQIHAIPPDLSDAQAILAEPLANVVHLFRLAAPSPGMRMGIVGAGLMGSMALQMAHHLGIREVLVTDVAAARLDSARQMGASLAIHAERQWNQVASFAGSGLDLVLDACGNQQARQQAFDLCRPGGTVILLGLAQSRGELDFKAAIMKEQRVLTSFGYTPADFRHSLDLLIARAVDLIPWTVEFPIAQGQQAFCTRISSFSSMFKVILRVR